MQNIYDNKEFFNSYTKMREGSINANNLIANPMLIELLPNLQGKRVLDIGCGFGDFCRLAVENGAIKALGIDISKKMIEKAKEINAKPNIRYFVKPMEKLNEINEKFDVVISSLAFHYVEDFDKLISDIKNLITPNGYLVFSQEHPIATAFMLPNNKSKLDTKCEIQGKRYYYISDYNNIGKRIVHWNIDGVIKYHRTFSKIINTLIENDFEIERVEESKANEEILKIEPKYSNQNDRPYFLFVKARKIKK